MIPSRSSHAALAAALALLAACADGAGPVDPQGPAPAGPLEIARVTCTADVRAGTLSCGRPGSAGSASGLIVPGPNGTYAMMQGANVAYDGSVWSADVTVQNLVPQALGTTDGTTLDAAGVRVFFVQPPTVTASTGPGSITFANASGTDAFTATGQTYYQYDEVLSTNEVSPVFNWQLNVPPAVTSFAFTVGVAAAVQFPDGWVDVTPAADTLVEGAAQALSATVRTALGDVVAGAPSWGSSDAAVATVDGSGNVTAVAPGLVTITATSGARSGSATLAVCPDLALGEVYTAVMPLASSLCFAGGASGNAEYTYMPVNLSTSSALSLTLTGAGIAAVTGPPTPNRVPGPSLAVAPLQAGGEDLHARMMERDRREAAQLLGRAGTRVSRGRARPGGPRALIVPGTPTVGDLWSLNVASGCSGALDTRTGQVRSIGAHVIVVADTTNPPGGFTTAQYDSIAAEFDSLAYAVDTANFGGPTDLDTNGRVVAFYTRAVNELSPPASSAVVSGFFTARDLFSSAPASCPRSNEGEMFYMLVPDPTGVVNSNVRTVSFVRGNTVGTMAHELQHLINASRRIYVEETVNLEEVWLNEGLSHIAEELVFYRASAGLAPRGNIVLSTLTTGPNASRRVAAFNTYGNPNFGRLRSFLQRPDTAGAFKDNDVLAVRGATWAFLRYAADRRNGVDATLWFDLVNTELTGKANLQDVLGVDPDAWLRDWIAALYADDAGVGVSSDYQTTSWSFRSVYGGLGGFPLGTRPLSNGVGLTLSYSRGGGTAFARFAVPTGGFAGVTALSGGMPPASPYALIVVRTK